MPDIFVVTTAYGNDTVLALGGQQQLLPIIAEAGADGVEIRRELLTETDLKHLPALQRAAAGHGLRCVYSAPEALFAPDGSLNALLSRLLDEANHLNARRLKLSLGHYRAGTDLGPLAALLTGQAVRLMVENDQTECGSLAPLAGFFQQVSTERVPVGMTFDMGNWHWVGESATVAAERLSPYVDYIHVKTAVQSPDGWRAVPPDLRDRRWRQLLAALPDTLPRGIEFPLQGEDLAAVTRQFVALLR